MSEADTLAALAAAISTYPAKVVLFNNHWRDNVEPETSTLIPAYSRGDIVVRDVDQLARIVSNCAQMNELNEWAEGTGYILESKAEPGKEVPADSVPTDATTATPASTESEAAANTAAAAKSSKAK